MPQNKGELALQIQSVMINWLRGMSGILPGQDLLF
jgi:hypothetical protein